MNLLAEAIKTVKADEGQLAVAICSRNQANIPPLSYRNDADARFSPVCWANAEEGIITEFRAAVLEILQRRFDEARGTYNNA